MRQGMLEDTINIWMRLGVVIKECKENGKKYLLKIRNIKVISWTEGQR